MKGEFKKLFSAKLLLMMMCIPMALSVLFTLNAAKSKTESSPGREKLLNDVINMGLSGEETIAYLEKMARQTLQDPNTPGTYEDTLQGDWVDYQMLLEGAKKIYQQFPQVRKNLVIEAQEKVLSAQAEDPPNEKAIRENSHVVELYNRVAPCELRSPGSGWSAMSLFFDKPIWNYIMIALAVMIAVRVFTIDTSTGAYRIVYATKKGHWQLFCKQLLVTFTVVAVPVLVHFGCPILSGACSFGLENLDLPVQQLMVFEFCPYQISVLEFLALRFGVILLFYLMVAAIAILMTVLMRKMLPAFAVSLVLTLAPLIGVQALAGAQDDVGLLDLRSKVYGIVRTVTPQCLLDINPYFEAYDCVDLYFEQCWRLGICIFITVLITLGCVLLSCLCYGKARRR